ncbi:MAG: uroporphyrinogen decarboxylase family protein [Candidatus Brocadiia bacterium]
MSPTIQTSNTETMTNRERIFATIRGEEVDRFPVWLKMTNRTWQSSQPAPYCEMGAEELLRAAGCDLMLGCWAGARKEMPHVDVSTTQENGLRRRTVETPDGTLVAEDTYDTYTESWHPTKFPADGAENLRRLRWLFKDTAFSVPADRAGEWAACQEELEAKDAFTMTGIGPSPLMNLVEHLCGPENTAYLLHDEPELFREVVDLMHRDRVRELKALLPHVAADSFWLTENTSTTLISPGMFEEYCMPQLREYGDLIVEHGKIAVHHMCGTLNDLLEMIDELPAHANEAYTTAPVGNVTLAEGRTRMPSKALIGGTNATLWLAPVEKIVAEVAADLAQCPDRRKIFLTSGGALPPPVTFEKARRVVAEFKRL